MKNSNSIQIGVVGVGHLGNFHVKQLSKIPEVDISGIFDINIDTAKKISQDYSIPLYSDLESLFEFSNAVSIVTPTSSHYEVANKALDFNCHIFIEKPITDNLDHAKLLLKKSKQRKKIIQVGHIERFNPAFIALEKIDLMPHFIELHRLAPFNPRGNDVPVILDLMIHDLDIVLSVVQSDIKDIKAKGVKVITNTVDIANARIEFENKCVVNLTASRISQKEMRKMRLFQKDHYITVDFHKCILEEYKVHSKKENIPNNNIIEIGKENKKYILYKKPKIEKLDALRSELKHFINSIQNNNNPKTDGTSAVYALEVALEIEKLILNNEK